MAEALPLGIMQFSWWQFSSCFCWACPPPPWKQNKQVDDRRVLILLDHNKAALNLYRTKVYEFSGVWVAVHFSLPGTKQPDYVENNFCWSISERCRNIHVLCAGQMEINAIIAYMDNHDSCSSVQDRKRWNARSWWQAEDNRFCRVEYTMTLVSLKLAFHNL